MWSQDPASSRTKVVLLPVSSLTRAWDDVEMGRTVKQSSAIFRENKSPYFTLCPEKECQEGVAPR